MSIDFTNLLSRTSSDAPKPSALPMGDYPGLVKSWKIGEKNRKQQVCPIITLVLGFSDWPDGEEPTPGINLAHTVMSWDVYAADIGGKDDTWRIFALAKSCQLETEGVPLAELLPQLIGQPVLIAVTHYTNRDGEPTAQINKVVGLPD